MREATHPFKLLENATPTNREGKLYVDYVLATAGKRQLFWSPGLKSKVFLREKSDGDIVKALPEPSDLLAFLSKAQWKVIKDADARAEVLSIAEIEGIEGLERWFNIYGESLLKPG